MVLQLRKKGSDDPMYAPARDVAYLYPEAIAIVNRTLEDSKDAIVRDLLKTHDISLGDLGEAAGAFCRFMNSAHRDPKADAELCLTRSGWFHCKPMAQVAYMYYVGTCMTATFFRGIREVTELGKAPSLVTIEQIGWTVKRMLIFARMSPWQRFLYRWCRPWRSWLWRRHRIKKD